LETEVLFAFLLVGNVLDHTANSDEFASIFVVLWNPTLSSLKPLTPDLEGRASTSKRVRQWIF
jgi:hypothetical protein